MKIQSISQFNYNSVAVKNNSKLASFKGYSEVLHDAVEVSINTESEAETLFRKIWTSLMEEANTSKKNSFSVLKEVFDKNGFRGLLHELWKANPKEDVAKILKNTEEDCENIVTRESEPLMTIYNFGKYGFWGRKTAPNDVKLVFYSNNQHEMIDFSLSKKGNLKTSQSNQINIIDNEFYMTTGTLKERSVSGLSGTERTHYNEDGSMPVIKNMILNGNAPQVY